MSVTTELLPNQANRDQLKYETGASSVDFFTTSDRCHYLTDAGAQIDGFGYFADVDARDDHRLNTQICMVEGLRSVAVFRFSSSGIFLGFKGENTGDADERLRILEKTAQWYLRIIGEGGEAGGPIASVLFRDLVRQLRASTSPARRASDLSARLFHAISLVRDDLQFSVWEVNYQTKHLARIFGFGRYEVRSRSSQEFDKGLLGYMAESWNANSEPLNVLVDDGTLKLDMPVTGRETPEELMSLPLFVKDIYEPIGDGDLGPWKSESELVVPMVYGGRLVGLLNVESNEPKLFSKSLVSLCQELVVPIAQAIHERRVQNLLRRILASGSMENLSTSVAVEVGNLMEAVSSAVFVWEPRKRSLVLQGTGQTISAKNGRTLKIGQKCYTERGVGLTRWSFENRLRLCIRDLPMLDDIDDPAWDEVRDDISHQLAEQLTGRWCVRAEDIEVEVERIGVDETDRRREFRILPDDAREFWHFQCSSGSRSHSRLLAQPVWTAAFDDEWKTRSVVCIPIVRPDCPGVDSDTEVAQGVIRFSRTSDRTKLGESELELLESISQQFSVVAAAQIAEEQKQLEHSLLEDAVQLPMREVWQQFQTILGPRLTQIRQDCDADLVIVRLLDWDELRLVATDGESIRGTEQRLSEEFATELEHRPLVIPRLIYRLQGGTGTAVGGIDYPGETVPPRSVYIEGRDHPILSKSRKVLGQDDDDGPYANLIASECAVPLIFRGRVVGSIAAIGFREAGHAVHRREPNDDNPSRWCSEENGIHHDAQASLEYIAEWLSPAVATLKSMSDQQRLAASMNEAVEALTEHARRSDVSGNSAYENQFEIARTIARIAALPNGHGLDLQQVFVGRYRPEQLQVFGIENGVFGITSFREAKARVFGADTGGPTSDASQPNDEKQAERLEAEALELRNKWKDECFAFPEPVTRPTVVVRSSKRQSQDRRRVQLQQSDGHRQVEILSGPEWDQLLDRWCDMFGFVNDGTKAAYFFRDRIEIAIVPIRETSEADPEVPVLICTQKRFRRSSEPTVSTHPHLPPGTAVFCADIELELIRGAYQIGEVARLAMESVELAQAQVELFELERGVDSVVHEAGSYIQPLLVELKNHSLDVNEKIAAIARYGRQLRRLNTCYSMLLHRESINDESLLKVSVADATRDIVEDFKWYCETAGIQFSAALPDDSRHIFTLANCELLQVALNVLFWNARRAVLLKRKEKNRDEYKGRIEFAVNTRQNGHPEQIEFTIVDDGIPLAIGIDEIGQWRKSGWNGLGIGLASATRIVEDFKGRLFPEDSDEQKVFRLVLPDCKT